MTESDELRARMRGLVEADLHAIRAAAEVQPSVNVDSKLLLDLDAYTTRLRDDLDRVTRERDEALAYVKDATVAITELTSGGSEFFGKRIAGIYTADLPFCVQRIRETRAGQFEHIRKLARELKAAEAALAKRDEEVARLRGALESARDFMREHWPQAPDLDTQYLAQAHFAAVDEALNQEPTNAE